VLSRATNTLFVHNQSTGVIQKCIPLNSVGVHEIIENMILGYNNHIYFYVRSRIFETDQDGNEIRCLQKNVDTSSLIYKGFSCFAISLDDLFHYDISNGRISRFRLLDGLKISEFAVPEFHSQFLILATFGDNLYFAGWKTLCITTLDGNLVQVIESECTIKSMTMSSLNQQLYLSSGTCSDIHVYELK
jgi:hypothetical protein